MLTSAAPRLGVKGVFSSSLRAISSQTVANSRPRTNDGSAISKRPHTSSGTVRIRPRKERGVISPYPTVVIAENVKNVDQMGR